MLDLKLYLDSGAQSGLKSFDILTFLLKINLIQRPHNFKILGQLDGKLFEVQIQQPYGNFSKKAQTQNPQIFSQTQTIYFWSSCETLRALKLCDRCQECAAFEIQLFRDWVENVLHLFLIAWRVSLATVLGLWWNGWTLSFYATRSV